MSPRLLVVEDEDAIADAVRFAPSKHGYEVDIASDGEAALESDPKAYDLVILDLMLPGIDGVEVCRRYRGHSAVPILMLTARTEELARVLGLEAGRRRLRVEAVLDAGADRARTRAAPPSRAGRAHDLDLAGGGSRPDRPRRPDSHVASKPVEVTQSEFRLLSLLATRPDQAVSRRDLARHLWHNDYVGERRT